MTFGPTSAYGRSNVRGPAVPQEDAGKIGRETNVCKACSVTDPRGCGCSRSRRSGRWWFSLNGDRRECRPGDCCGARDLIHASFASRLRQGEPQSERPGENACVREANEL